MGPSVRLLGLPVLFVSELEAGEARPQHLGLEAAHTYSYLVLGARAAPGPPTRNTQRQGSWRGARRAITLLQSGHGRREELRPRGAERKAGFAGDIAFKM